MFVSYVREDSAAVDELCKVLEAAQIPYWRDRKDLGPGDAWKTKIRDAIQSNALVFLPCFSENSRAKQKSYMNEELTLAVEEFRKMPPGRTWIIPVRFDDGSLPGWDLGAGRSLDDYNYVDLFGDAHIVSAATLVATINRLMGEPGPDAATVQAAVAQTLNGDRAVLLRRLTKEMVPDPARRIQLSDTVSQETRALLAALNDETRFPTGSMTVGTAEEQIVALVDRATAIWHLVEAFCATLQVATQWAEPTQLGPWTTGLRALGADANKVRSGVNVLLHLHYLPTLITTMAVGLTAVGTDRWDNVKALIVDQTVTERGRSGSEALIDVAHPWAPFQNAELVAHVLARTVTMKEDPVTAHALFASRKVQEFYTPVSEWLYKILRPSFQDLYPDDDHYSDQFDQAEIMLGVISQDLAIQEGIARGRTWRSRSRWFGRSTWRANHHSNALELITRQLAAQQSEWPPLRAGLFGRDPARADAAVVAYTETFSEISRTHWWVVVISRLRCVGVYSLAHVDDAAVGVPAL